MKKPVVYVIGIISLSVCAGIVVGMGIGRKSGYEKHLAFVGRFVAPAEESRGHALSVLSRSLGLSKEQTEKIGDILDAARAKGETFKKETLENLETIKEGINTEIKAILTADQQVKFARLMTERKQREGVITPFGGHPESPPPEEIGP